MGAGQYKDFITIQQPPTAQDAAGQPTGAWTDFCTGWADIRNLSGLETLRANADASIVRVSIRLRGYRTDLTAAMRVVCGSDVYRITAVLPDKAGRAYVDLACEMST
jgi:SPP1 family predicted phage head-tail adaptor